MKYTTVDTRKDGVRFKTVRLKQLGDEYEEALSQYESKQRQLVQEFMVTVASYEEPLMEICELVTEMDIFCAWAHVFSSSTHPYVRPKVFPAGEGDLVLRKLRHPIMEMQDTVQYIPNDVEFKRDTSRFHIITGPNMGGKSTYIRSAGVAVLMAQMGCFVPCSYAEVSVVDSILCRVGAGDSQSRGVSTFMAEMLETTAILESSTKYSLLIIDELGRGTSTYDGFGLAWAISEWICTKIQAFCFFATHFHELTDLAARIDGVKNLHVSAKPMPNELILLYKVMDGPCDQSFGIHVAEMANFPQSVLLSAKRKAEELERYSSTNMIHALGSNNKDVDGDVDMDLQQPQKKMRTREELEGEEILSRFVDEFCQLPLTSMTEEESRKKLNEMKEKLEKDPNPFVQKMLKEAK